MQARWNTDAFPGWVSQRSLLIIPCARVERIEDSLLLHLVAREPRQRLAHPVVYQADMQFLRTFRVNVGLPLGYVRQILAPRRLLHRFPRNMGVNRGRRLLSVSDASRPRCVPKMSMSRSEVRCRAASDQLETSLHEREVPRIPAFQSPDATTFVAEARSV